MTKGRGGGAAGAGRTQDSRLELWRLEDMMRVELSVGALASDKRGPNKKQTTIKCLREINAPSQPP